MRSRAEEPAREFLRSPAQTDVFRTEKPGDLIGRYKLLQQIGEGGGGIVYMAEQEEPVRRRVALKIIKLGMETREVVARFEAERQALALMDHPNIAKILDAGVTATPLPASGHPLPSSDEGRGQGEESSRVTFHSSLATHYGRPYFVMELVRGTPITHYCDENRLATRQRLELFVQVCQAVQHAHQKGIIHRDLKPSNVLVTELDGRPTPKVIDFGVAKATEQRLTEKTLFTRFGQLIGTPAYMSPEQAGFGGLDIDTRSDVYSLGVLLYELLTGRPPFDGKKLLEAGYEGILKTIREVEPPKPSTKLSTLSHEELVVTASQRNAEPGKLNGLVRGELDWIVMKALEKDRARRYETATGFANDILRHLNNEPVLARPPSKLYEFQKTVRRHKFGFAAAAAVFLSLFLGLGFSTWTLSKERKARTRGDAEKRKALSMAQFLQSVLGGVSPEVAQGRDTEVLRMMLDDTSERVGRELADQPEAEVGIRITAGSVYAAIGQLDQAAAQHRQAVARARQFPRMDYNMMAGSLQNLAETLRKQGNLGEAEEAFREALEILNRNGDTNSEGAAAVRNSYGIVLRLSKKLDDAERVLREAQAIQEQLPGQLYLASTLNNLANVLYEQEKLPAAEAMMERVVELDRKRLSKNHPDLALSLGDLANLRHARGDLAGARNLLMETLEIMRQNYPDGHPYMATSLHNLASLQRDEHKLDEAEITARQALAMDQKFLQGPHPDLALAFGTLAWILVAQGDQGKLEEAEERSRQALAVYTNQFSNDHVEVAKSLGNLSEILLKRDKLPEAETAAQKALEIFQRKIPEDYRTFMAQAAWGEILLAQKRYSEAETPLRKGVEGLLARKSKLRIPAKERLKGLLGAMAQLYEQTNHPEQAAEWKQKEAEFEPAK